MAEPPGRLERVPLAALLLAALLGSGTRGALAAGGLALAACLAGLAFGPVALSRPVRRVAQLGGDAAIAAAVVLGFVWTVYPVVPEATLARFAEPLTFVLAFLTALAFVAPTGWPPARTLLPAALGLLVIGALPSPSGWRFPSCLAAAAAALAAWLLVERRSFDRRAVRPRLLALCGFVAATAALTLGLARLLPWAQPRVEAATISWFAGKSGSGQAGFSLTSRLGDIEELALSRRTVLRAFTDVPQRLRASAFARFDGRAWAAQPAHGAADLTEAGPLPAELAGFFQEVPGHVLATRADLAPASPGTPLVRTRIVQASGEIPTLLSPIAPTLVGMAGRDARLSEDGILTPSPSGPVEIYAIVNRLGGPGAGQPAEAATLQLPPEPDARIAELAASLGGKDGPPEERVRRTLHHLERCCRYSLKVPRPTARDPIAGFLFETRRGYCEYFATAAALLLRLQGVPTRYVTGFNVRDESLLAGHYLVRESDAHAWIESYLPGRGWLEFDPTPSAQYAELHKGSEPGAATALLERLLALASEIGARLRAGSPLSSARWALRRFGGGLLALAALAGVILARRRLASAFRPAAQRPSEDAGDPRVRELLTRVDAMLRRRGHPRPATRAPLEHLESLAEGVLEPPLRFTAVRAVDCFYRSRYGGAQPPAALVAELLRVLPPA